MPSANALWLGDPVKLDERCSLEPSLVQSAAFLTQGTGRKPVGGKKLYNQRAL